MNSLVENSPLVNPTDLPLLNISAVATDRVLVVAPHPDDETLGCGGAIALLRSIGCKVQILVISDGTMSHPHSRKYPAPALRALRESETKDATASLGVDVSDITFVGLPDGAVATQTSTEIKEALASFRPNTVFLPWRHDPHPDHRASYKLIQTALVDLALSPRIIEYPIWDWDPQQRGNLPEPNRVKAWRLDISKVVELKQLAIAAYRSQTTDLIDDDPQGFRLTPEMLANFTRPWEVYIEAQ